MTKTSKLHARGPMNAKRMFSAALPTALLAGVAMQCGALAAEGAVPYDELMPRPARVVRCA